MTGSCSGGDDAPTEIASDAVPGEPTVHCSGPALPDAVTATIPFSTALFNAILVGQSGPFTSFPNDKLITSILSFIARSMAITTDSVVPTPPGPSAQYAYNEHSGATPFIRPFAPIIPATWVP